MNTENKADMPHVKVYIHFVWSTKNRQQFLSDKVTRHKMWQHIKENATLKGIYIDCINGYTDHCHCLISLGVDQTLKGIMQLIKGESSYWINKEMLIDTKFEWQDEYFAASVSETMIERTRNYIKDQENHHCQVSFQNEYDDFLKRCGFIKISD